MSDALAQAVLDVLRQRKGFDHWWDHIDADIQREILEEIATLLHDALRSREI
jgi:hypothetical protein